MKSQNTTGNILSTQGPLGQGQRSVENAIMKLLTKRGLSPNNHSQEILQYKCTAALAVDPLHWWKTDTYKRLSRLAPAVLRPTIPATSTLSDFFSHWHCLECEAKLTVATRG